MAGRYMLPTWIVPVSIWHFGHPTSGAPDVEAVGNFTQGKRVFSGDGFTTSTPSQWFPVSFLLLPNGTDIRGEAGAAAGPDTVECPTGSGRYYSCQFADYVALGFPNQHIQAILTQITPMPDFPPVPPPVGGHILIEDGSDMLLEDGTLIILE